MKKPLTLAEAGRKELPELPKGKKVLVMYRSNDYINVVCENKYYIEFFLWDGISSSYSYIVQFPKYEK